MKKNTYIEREKQIVIKTFFSTRRGLEYWPVKQGEKTYIYFRF